MESDIDNIITIKQLLNNSISNVHFDYIKQLLNKTIQDCNLLYTQVCYLIKLFLLFDYENNKELHNDYIFNELFIRNCFKLIKTGKINNESCDDNALTNRLYNFYNEYNLNDDNEFKFTKPNNVDSITHITDALSRDIQTNITNNIILNYTKYLREYVIINLNSEFKNIDTKIINKILNDILSNTISYPEYRTWIDKHKKLIIPNFVVKVSINDFNDGIDKHYKIFNKIVNDYVKENQELKDLIVLNNDNKKDTINNIINFLMNKNIIINDRYNDWVNKNKFIIINKFNSFHFIDIEKEIQKNPYKFIPYMLFMNRNLELNKSKKKYQIIPLRTNMIPKFIPINIDSLVDILDSKYLLGNIKNYYHNDSKKGLILFNTYFKFDSKYIKNIIKKGFEFSGLIYTNGYEINYIFNSKTYGNNKKNFHSKGKEEIKLIKENTKDMNPEQKEEFIKKHQENNEKNKKEKIKLNGEKQKNKKQNDKDNHNKTLKNVEIELIKLKTNYDKNLLENEEDHYKNLKLEFDKIDKINNNKNLMKDILKKYEDKLVSYNIYLKHEYDRNYLTLISDYDNTIDIKYDEIKNKEIKNNNLIKELEKNILKSKNELKILKKEKFNDINKDYKKKTKQINLEINNGKKSKKTLHRLIKKIKKKSELLNYETIQCKSLTLNHMIKIIDGLINLITIIKKMKISICLNDYLKEFEDMNIYFYQCSTDELKKIINLCLKYILVDISNINNNNSNNENNIIKLLKSRLIKIEKIENKKDNEYKNKYSKIVLELNKYSSTMNKLMNEKRKIEKEMIMIFKEKPNEITKIDNMSKKTLSILDKMNWVVIDPGVNSLLTIMSKDKKTKMSYSKCEYLNKTKRKEILKKIERIKKEKITNLENELTKDKLELRLRVSNIYKNFNKYLNLKMKMHNEIVNLYNDVRLNKLKWFTFINEKRSESKLVNNIKKKYGNDVVLIIGDWSMKKEKIRSISTPNKKYEKILNKNFTMLKIDEFRTSIIESKTELICDNLIKEINYDKMNIKSIYSLEKLKEKNVIKYKKRNIK